MDQLETLEYAMEELRRVVSTLDDTQMEVVTNCAPWTVRQLASHALNNQLVWAGIVTGQQLVSFEDAMGAVPHDGDLAAFADDVTARASAMWSTAGVLEAMHTTPFVELPGSVVVTFPTIDALAHAWDLSSSVGHPVEFEPRTIPSISTIVDAVCTDDVRAMGIIKDATQPPADANDTERLMALAGRTIER